MPYRHLSYKDESKMAPGQFAMFGRANGLTGDIELRSALATALHSIRGR